MRTESDSLEANSTNALLERATQVLMQAEENLHTDTARRQTPSTKRLMANILTERAALNGTRLIRLNKLLKTPPAPQNLFQDVWNLIRETQSIWGRAFSYAEDNAHAYDTACWVNRFCYNNTPPSEVNNEILLDWCDVIDRYRQLDLTPDQEMRLEEYERNLTEALGDEEKFEQLFHRVEATNPSYAHVLKARHILEFSKDVDGACDYIVSQFSGDELYQDRYALLFYYRLWWLRHTGNTRYFKPDTPLLLNFSDEKWKELLHLTEARLKLEGEKENSLVLFHAAWALIQKNNGRRAKDFLDLLKSGTKGSARRGRALAVISTPNGAPKEFSGQTRFSTDSVNGRCWVDSLQMELPYKYFDFYNSKRSGTPLGPFYVALNYRGAYIVVAKGGM